MRVQHRIFVGSSSDGLHMAKALCEHLSRFAKVTLWSDPGVFPIGRTTLETLKVHARGFSAAVMLFTPDDLSEIREELFLVARDNVVLELGLFLGVLPARRVLFAVPKSTLPFRVPTDLAGYVFGQYEYDKEPSRAPAATEHLGRRIQEALDAPFGDEPPIRYVTGEMQVRELTSIGRDAQHAPEPAFTYAVSDAEVVVDGQRVTVRGRVTMRGVVTFEGTFEGYGDFLNDAAYVIYTIRADHGGQYFKGVGVLQMPSLGAQPKGYWMSQDLVEAGRSGLAVGDVTIDVSAEEQTGGK